MKPEQATKILIEYNELFKRSYKEKDFTIILDNLDKNTQTGYTLKANPDFIDTVYTWISDNVCLDFKVTGGNFRFCVTVLERAKKNKSEEEREVKYMMKYEDWRPLYALDTVFWDNFYKKVMHAFFLGV